MNGSEGRRRMRKQWLDGDDDILKKREVKSVFNELWKLLLFLLLILFLLIERA